MGMFTALGVILRDAPDGLGARAGGGADRRGGGAAGRRGHALLHVLARRDRGGDRRHGALPHPGASAGSGGRAGGRRRPAGGRAAAAPTARTCSRSTTTRASTRGQQGRTLLLVVIGCTIAAGVLRWLALRVDRRLERVQISARARTIAFGAAGVAGLLALAVATVAFDLPDRIADQRRAFVEGNAPPGGVDLRTRLTEVGNNGRLDIWRVALRAGGAPTRGGAPARARSGSRGSASGRRRPRSVVDAHSLYYEVRAELGWIGIALLAVVFAVPLGVGDPPLWGPGRHAHAAFLAAGGGAADPRDGRLGLGDARALRLVLRRRRAVLIAAPAAARGRAPEPRRLTRLLAGLALLLVAVTPVTVAVSQARLNRSVERVRATATARPRPNAALGSLDALSSQAEAFEVLGWCDARAGQQRARGRRDAQRAAPRPRQLALRLRARGRRRRWRARTRAPAAALAQAAQPARPADARAGARAAAEQRRAAASRRGAAGHPVRLTTRGGPEPASRRSVAVGCG